MRTDVAQVATALGEDARDLLSWIHACWCKPFEAHGKEHRNFVLRPAINAGRVRLEQVDPSCNYHADAPDHVADELALDDLKRQRLVRVRRVSGTGGRKSVQILTLEPAGEKVGAWLSGQDAPLRKVFQPAASAEDELLAALSAEAHSLLIDAFRLADSTDVQTRKDSATRTWRALQTLAVDCLVAIGEQDHVDDPEAATKHVRHVLQTLKDAGSIGKTQVDALRRSFSDAYDLVNRVRHQDHDRSDYVQAVRYALFASHEVAATVAEHLVHQPPT